MLRLAADENLNVDIVSGVLRRKHEIDFLRIQDSGLPGADDGAVLAWAAGEGRVLFTHDANTIPDHAYERVRTGQTMSGVWIVPAWLAVGQAVEDILLIAEASREGEYEGQVKYLPLR